MDAVFQTVNQLGSVLRRSAECRRELTTSGRDWSLLPDALALLDDLDEQALDLVNRAGWTAERGPPPPASRAWRGPSASVH